MTHIPADWPEDSVAAGPETGGSWVDMHLDVPIRGPLPGPVAEAAAYSCLDYEISYPVSTKPAARKWRRAMLWSSGR
ncbi:hypothetical protein J7I98_37960 [Streptomyces sp. ISL-98]|uniref:hypothetical protein n=1 Tax=Streptomyces sp. ISL-98 TaxID=2819192 RepID=UPI001BE579C2|nr:hypothetical protein [Streptomyces sp. ISL-98]MBT2511483.1 hypothetical protein [Streptomyces sp. ISL-98]